METTKIKEGTMAKYDAMEMMTLFKAGMYYESRMTDWMTWPEYPTENEGTAARQAFLEGYEAALKKLGVYEDVWEMLAFVDELNDYMAQFATGKHAR